jgi:(p)ppGpp synthase/HD superfamily hydrolase
MDTNSILTGHPELKRTRDFAIEVHRSQQYGFGPYEGHLDDVVAILASYGYDDMTTLRAGYLHDTVEDTKGDKAELRRLIVADHGGEDVLIIVEFCTDAPGPNRKTRKAVTYARMKQEMSVFLTLEWAMMAPPIRETYEVLRKASRVKLADRLGNLRRSLASDPGLLEMYRKEAKAFRDALYVQGLADAMWVEYDTLTRTS